MQCRKTREYPWTLCFTKSLSQGKIGPCNMTADFQSLSHVPFSHCFLHCFQQRHSQKKLSLRQLYTIMLLKIMTEAMHILTCKFSSYRYLAAFFYFPPSKKKRVVQGGLWHGSQTEKIGNHGSRKSKFRFLESRK